MPDDCGGHSPISSDDVHREGSTSFDTQEQEEDTPCGLLCEESGSVPRLWDSASAFDKDVTDLLQCFTDGNNCEDILLALPALMHNLP